jgi:hypothetical protein
MELRQSLFWDSDVKTIDLQKHKKSIITRVLMRGTHEEFAQLLKFYGKRTVKKTALTTRYLDKYTLAFCVTLFKTPKTEFRCYIWSQSNPTHWDY